MSLLPLNEKILSWLIDPDKVILSELKKLCAKAEQQGFKLILVGGSIISNKIEELIIEIKKHTSLPVYIFPGSIYQISNKADGILFTSLISGRNPEYLIGQQVQIAPLLKKYHLDVVSVAYILIESGITTSVEYISNTKPIPASKVDIIQATCYAAEFLGFKMIYLEAGSGALNPVPLSVVKTISSSVNIPIIVGGGIKKLNVANSYFQAGADIVVMGTSIEEGLFND